jgi:hypothetical protein
VGLPSCRHKLPDIGVPLSHGFAIEDLGIVLIQILNDSAQDVSSRNQERLHRQIGQVGRDENAAAFASRLKFIKEASGDTEGGWPSIRRYVHVPRLLRPGPLGRGFLLPGPGLLADLNRIRAIERSHEITSRNEPIAYPMHCLDQARLSRSIEFLSQAGDIVINRAHAAPVASAPHCHDQISSGKGYMRSLNK